LQIAFRVSISELSVITLCIYYEKMENLGF
jgi:hypothetical protein